ncbi:hypothetical protein BCR41DRAFT_359070 [Lobosporangium transversale]|uniref:Uncharacterized protein n=1 Tax=Lobosporangium transversale TaxID=64571 RepID=A0A1Y2GER2_9FUNG|nr:hypothetical protein BCR41DRAFT_359070 [Lobosporangium transversale]ORZ08814.1 hypothetical protein BCR41DRAFT_359070 [Lobosporangium transversale]|eukprot:XP_021878597.1 hypothetical protein BCR41DRAFT_359070 [Lobosporangium transversale]
MDSVIAPPASFGLISGTAFASASPTRLAEILESLELASLEQEHWRLQRAIQQLKQSNKEIADFIEQEQQQQQQQKSDVNNNGDSSSDDANQIDALGPDPEFLLAIEENKAIIAKYERICEQLMEAIVRRRATENISDSDVQEEVSAMATDNEGNNDAAEGGIFL